MSLPGVYRAEDVEMIRDGGSWAATFSDSSNRRYILFFKIRHTEQGGFYTPKQHLSPPFIIDCDPTLRPENASELAGPRTSLSWEGAREILRNIRAEKLDLTRPRRSLYYDEWLQEMIEVANRDGAPT